MLQTKDDREHGKEQKSRQLLDAELIVLLINSPAINKYQQEQIIINNDYRTL